MLCCKHPHLAVALTAETRFVCEREIVVFGIGCQIIHSQVITTLIQSHTLIQHMFYAVNICVRSLVGLIRVIDLNRNTLLFRIIDIDIRIVCCRLTKEYIIVVCVRFYSEMSRI